MTLKILTFNWHEGYIHLLAKTGYEFDVVERWKGGRYGWIKEFRPLSPNCRLVSEDEAKVNLESGYYDRIICHNLQDFVLVSESPIPKVLLHHNKMAIETNVFDKDKQKEILEKLREMYRWTKNLTLVFVSQAKKDSWGLDGEVILPGIDLSEYGNYKGDIPKVLRIGNGLKLRDIMLGYSVQERILNGLPSIILGLNPDLPESYLPHSWDELKTFMRSHRVYLNTTMPPYEDGYNLGLLEAMATGMSVVSIANPTSPIENGINGFISNDESYLRGRIEELMGDLPVARSLGQRARETVMDRFPIDKFIREWKRVLDSSLHKSDNKIKNSRFRIQDSKTCLSHPARHLPLKILMSYTSNPVTTASYLEKAFRKYHEVITYGSAINDEIIRMWNLEMIRDKVRAHDIPYITPDISEVFNSLSSKWVPDLFLWIESGVWDPIEGFEKLPCLKVCYLIDTHLGLEKRLAWAKNFDIVFIAQKADVARFKENGIENVFWIPLACEPEIHGKKTNKKLYDIGFVASLNNQKRVELLNKLKERFNVYDERCFLERMVEVFSQSKIVFNISARNDLNMRVFEALCSGSMLLADEAKGSGLIELFQDRKHLVIYKDEKELLELADYYLIHEEERERIAEEGMKEVLAKHTYEHRVKDMIEIISKNISKAKWYAFDNHPEAVVLQPYCIGKGIDVGCGFRKTHPGAIGVDIIGKGEMGKYGCVKDRQSVADIKTSGDNLYMFQNGEFDYVVSRHNLEHYIDPIKTLNEWKRVLKIGGILGMVLPDESKINTIALDPTHKHVFTPESIKNLLELIGDFEIEKIEPVIENWSFVVIARKIEQNEFRTKGRALLSTTTSDKDNPDYYRNERKDVEMLIPHGVMKVLDVGCGEGMLGKRLLQKGIREVVGIEINPEVAKRAQGNLTGVICGDIETIELPFESGYFDCIIFADVLEHLREPFLVLKRFREYLSDTGVIVASIPNVRYYVVINMLVEGYWRYQDYGILDRTHLRFFTKKEIEKLFQDAGFEITGISENIDPAYNNINITSMEIEFGRVRIKDLKPDELRDLFVPQYLIRAKKAIPKVFDVDSGELDKTKNAIEDYLSLHPLDLDMLYKYAVVCHKLGLLKEALESIDRMLLFDPENRDAVEMKKMIDQKNPNMVMGRGI